MIVLAAADIVGILEFAGLIAVAIVALGVVIFAHEWGHFMVGRRVGIRAEAFSIGFGPILWRKKIGETEYRLSAIPFGGYVKFSGMEGTEEKTPQEIERGFYAASPDRRILTSFAGPFMNLILAFALFFVLWGTGRKVPESMTTTVIGGVREGSPAEEAGLQPRDRIVSISGRKVDGWQDVLMGVALGGETLDVGIERDGSVMHKMVRPREDPRVGARIMGVEPQQAVTVASTDEESEARRMGLRKGDLLLRLDDEPILNGPAAWQEKLRKRAGKAIRIVVARNGAEVTLTGTMPEGSVAPAPDSAGSKGKPPVLGIRMDLVYAQIHENPIEATAYCFNMVGRTLKGLVTRRVKAKGLAGPVGIVGVITYSLRISFTSFLWWAAFISLNLAVINLLPIPVVDGGHIMFSVIEKVRRKPVREKTMAIITNVFAVLIIAFFLYVTFNDVKRMFPSGGKDEKTPAAEEDAPDQPENETPGPEGPSPE